MIAYYKFETKVEHLCQVVAVNVDHFASYGRISLEELKIVLNVMSRIVSPTSCVPVGQQAETKFLIDSEIHIINFDTAEDAARFVRDAGVHLEAGKKPYVDSRRFVACEFGEPHPNNGHQRVIHARIVDPASYGLIPTTTPDRQGPFGLRWTEKTRSVSRWVGGSTKPAEFNGRAIAFKIFLYLCTHDKPCSTAELLDHVWGKGSGDPDALRHHIGSIKKLLGPLGLTVNSRRSVGYTLAEHSSDSHDC